jgi:hypothetical protein
MWRWSSQRRVTWKFIVVQCSRDLDAPRNFLHSKLPPPRPSIVVGKLAYGSVMLGDHIYAAYCLDQRRTHHLDKVVRRIPNRQSHTHFTIRAFYRPPNQRKLPPRLSGSWAAWLCLMLARENSHTFEVAWISHKEHDGTTIGDGTHLSSIKRVSFSHLIKQIAIVGRVNLYRRPIQPTILPRYPNESYPIASIAQHHVNALRNTPRVQYHSYSAWRMSEEFECLKCYPP